MSSTWDGKALKATPVSADEVLIIDTEDSRNQKRVTIQSMPFGGGEVFTWTNDHSMDSFKLTAGAGNDVVLNIPTGQILDIQVAGGNEFLFSASIANAVNAEWQEAGVPISPIGKNSHYVNASDVYPNVTDGVLPDIIFESPTNLVNVQGVTFLAGANDFASYTWIPPIEWDAGTVTVKFYWNSPNGTAAQVVEFQIAANAYSSGDLIDVAYPATVSVTDTLTGVASIDITAESSAITIGNTPAKGDMIIFQIERDALAGSDTITGAVRLVGMEIFYTTDAANSE